MRSGRADNEHPRVFRRYCIPYRANKKPVEMVMGLPPEIAPIMLLGFLRKDVSIALLAPLHLTAQQFIIASIFWSSTLLYLFVFTMLKELGVKTGNSRSSD